MTTQTQPLDVMAFAERYLLAPECDRRDAHWITYSPDVNNDYDYEIIRYGAHDGTFLFTLGTIQKAVMPLIERSTYYKPAYNPNRLGYRYTIGDGVIETEYTKVNIAGRQQDGVRETVRIPVRFTCKEAE